MSDPALINELAEIHYTLFWIALWLFLGGKKWT